MAWEKYKDLGEMGALEKYKHSKRCTKKLVTLAKETKRKEPVSDLDKADRQGHGQILRIAKQMANERQDVSRVKNCQMSL